MYFKLGIIFYSFLAGVIGPISIPLSIGFVGPVVIFLKPNKIGFIGPISTPMTGFIGPISAPVTTYSIVIFFELPQY